jgi:hypothetical protein
VKSGNNDRRPPPPVESAEERLVKTIAGFGDGDVRFCSLGQSPLTAPSHLIAPMSLQFSFKIYAGAILRCIPLSLKQYRRRSCSWAVSHLALTFNQCPASTAQDPTLRHPCRTALRTIYSLCRWRDTGARSPWEPDPPYILESLQRVHGSWAVATA